jgi:hypothetical protein
LNVLLISGVLGFWVGFVCFPTWAIPVESAQVVAGLVRYPADNPFYIYHTRVWTLLVQVSAVLLRIGMSEIAISHILSGVLGMVSLQALSMLAYAISNDAVIAIGSAVVVLVSRVTDMGPTYPVMLVDTHHTYGALGLSLLVLVTALLGARMYRLGGLLLGLAPAVHASLAFWIGLTMVIAFALDYQRAKIEFRPALTFVLLGGALAAVSLLIQLTVVSRSLPVPHDVATRYFRAFVATWDEHRRPVQIRQAGVIVNVAALALSLAALRWMRAELSSGAAFLLRVSAVSGVLGLVAMCFTWIPAANQPTILSMLMPARLLNYNVMAMCPLVIGVLAGRRAALSGAALCLFLAALLVSDRSLFGRHIFDPTLVVLVGTAAAVVHRKKGSDPFFVFAIGRIATVGVAVIAAWHLLGVKRPTTFYRDRTNDEFFATVASETEGVVLTAGSYQLVQLYTRRPVLIDGGGLDTVTYAPDTGPAMAAILRDVYDIDFLHPPAWAKGSSLLPHDYVRSVWSRFPLERWQEIRRRYNVTQVLARNDYTLNLPIAAEEGSFRLYRVPQ